MKIIRTAAFLLALTGCAEGAPEAMRNNPHYQLPLEELFNDACARELAKDALTSLLREQGRAHKCIEKINYRGLDGLTPLFWPIRHQNMRGVRTMLSLGAKADVEFTGRASPNSYVTYAIYTHDMELLVLLLENGAEPSEHKDRGLWALRSALLSDNYAALKVLLDSGVSANAADSFSNSILYRAIAGRDYRGAYILLKAGADPNMRSSMGITPVDLLKKYGCRVPTVQEEWCPKVYELLEVRYGISLER